MTGKRTEPASERKTRKLKVKKETLKELGVKRSDDVKGGIAAPKPGTRAC
jgi:hypothetical protein